MKITIKIGHREIIIEEEKPNTTISSYPKRVIEIIKAVVDELIRYEVAMAELENRNAS